MNYALYLFLIVDMHDLLTKVIKNHRSCMVSSKIISKSIPLKFDKVLLTFETNICNNIKHFWKFVKYKKKI